MNARQLIKIGMRSLMSSFPLEFLINITNKRILLPFYHTVSDEGLPHIDHLYKVRNVELFINDLDYLCKYYKPITSDELYQIVIEKRKITKPVFHLTFDDGLKQIYSTIAPILIEKGIPATFFVNTDFIDNKALFFRYKVSLIIEHLNSKPDALLEFSITKSAKSKLDAIAQLKKLEYSDLETIDSIAEKLGVDFNGFLVNYQPYLKSKEIVALLDNGFTIGSHSLDHPFFKKITVDEQQHQVSASLLHLTSHFNITDNYFSFPFSDEKVKNSLFKWLYEIEKCKLSFGISGLKEDVNKFHLHRIPMENGFGSAEEIIKTEYFYYLLKAPFGKNTIKRND